MTRDRSKPFFAAAFMLTAIAGLAGCLGSEAKSGADNAAADKTQQVSAQLEKPYPLNEQGEILAEIPPAILAQMKENLRKQAQLSAAANLEDLYDPVTGRLRDAAKLAEIQHNADHISAVLSKGAAQ